MASWVTHLIIADAVMNEFPALHRRGFCVGNIAPDCNVENEDWSTFTPSREVTHWMTGERKKLSDCGGFYVQYLSHRNDFSESEASAFLLGYYTHLLTDAAFQAFIRDKNRVKAIWERIKADKNLRAQAANCIENYDSVKALISRRDRMEQIYTFEAEYLQAHKNSGYLTEILPLTDFPDYLDYLPKGCIVRKIGVMGYIPQIRPNHKGLIAMSKEEYTSFIKSTAALVIHNFRSCGLL